MASLPLALTHWGRVTHICVGRLIIIGSDNGLLPERRQAIIWTSAGILLIGPLGTNFSEILIGIQTFSFKKMRLKMSSAKWRPFCLGPNVLTRCWISNRGSGDSRCHGAHLMSLIWNQVMCALTYLIPMLVSNPGETLIPVTSGKGIVWKGWMDTEKPLASVTPLGYSWISANSSSCRPECKEASKPLALRRSMEALWC